MEKLLTINKIEINYLKIKYKLYIYILNKKIYIFGILINNKIKNKILLNYFFGFL